jgi:hypothetical protein
MCAAQRSRQTVGYAEVRRVAAQRKRRELHFQRCKPFIAECPFPPSPGVVQQPNVGAAALAVEYRRERMYRDVNDAIAASDRRADEVVDARAVRPIDLAQQPFTLVGRQLARDRREQAAVMLGPIDVDEQPRRRVREQRCIERFRERARDRQRAGVPAAVRIEQRTMTAKQRRPPRRNSVAAVFASDDDARASIDRVARQRDPARHAAARNIRAWMRQSHSFRYVADSDFASTRSPTERSSRLASVPSVRITSRAS